MGFTVDFTSAVVVDSVEVKVAVVAWIGGIEEAAGTNVDGGTASVLKYRWSRRNPMD